MYRNCPIHHRRYNANLSSYQWQDEQKRISCPTQNEECRTINDLLLTASTPCSFSISGTIDRSRTSVATCSGERARALVERASDAREGCWPALSLPPTLVHCSVLSPRPLRVSWAAAGSGCSSAAGCCTWGRGVQRVVSNPFGPSTHAGRSYPSMSQCAVRISTN